MRKSEQMAETDSFEFEDEEDASISNKGMERFSEAVLYATDYDCFLYNRASTCQMHTYFEKTTGRPSSSSQVACAVFNSPRLDLCSHRSTGSMRRAESPTA
jgi:hypothetical protein